MDEQAKQAEIERLTQIIREGTHDEALAAVHELREKGWLTDGSLKGADMRGAFLMEADLTEAELREADLSGAYLSNSILRNATLIGAKLRGTSLYKASIQWADLSETDLQKAVLNSAILLKANLHGARLIGADLSEAKLFKVNLSGASLHGASLSLAGLGEANMQKAILSETDLTEATLQGADLRGAKLRGANLYGTRLDRANLSGASLHMANLRETSLREANLHGAYLQGAYLSGANLEGVDFTRVTCGDTVFDDIDLSLTTGLKTIEHRGPSGITTRTLYRSRGQIPEVFLRGCGVPEIMITYLPALMEKAFDFYSCFISYSHADEDKQFAKRLYDKLQGEGIRCWLDEHELLPGDDIFQEVDRGIRYWDKVLLCCSEQSLTSWWVDNEIKTAFEKEQRIMKDTDRDLGGQRILALIPLDLDGYLLSDDYRSGMKTQLQSRLAADFTSWKDHDVFESAVQQVIKALRTKDGKPPPPEPKL